MDRFSRYIKATINEMKHVKWPSQNQALSYSALVIGVSALVMLFVSLTDFVFTSGIDFVISKIN